MKSILLIIPYFGAFNSHFGFWLQSVSNNPSVNWLLVTDNKVENPPGNVTVLNITFTQLKEKARERLDFPFVLDSPYKLCDFKPLYSIIFSEHCDGYDFWGHCDMDMIFGNIRQFISPDMLEKYDRILSRGHLTIYRNNKEIANLFRVESPLIDSYKEVYNTPYPVGFDEWGFVYKGRKWMGLSNLWKQNRSIHLYDEIIFDDICPYKNRFVSAQKKGIESEKNKENIVFLYEEGNLWRLYTDDGEVKKEETLYVHLQKRNMKIGTNDYNKYIITPNRFSLYCNDLDVRFLKRNSKSCFSKPALYYKIRKKISSYF